MASRRKKFSLRAKQPEPGVVYFAENPLAIDENYDNFDQAPQHSGAPYQELSTSTMQVQGMYTNKSAQPRVEFTDTHQVRTADKVAKEVGVSKIKTESVSKEGFVCYLVTMTVVMLVVLACFVAVFIEIANVKSTSEMTSAQVQSAMSSSGGQNLSMNSSTDITQYLQQLNQSLLSLDQRLQEQVARLENTLSRSTMMNSNNMPQTTTCTINNQVTAIENTVTQNLTMIGQESTTLRNRNSQISVSTDTLRQMLNQNMLLLNQYDTTSDQSSLVTISSCAALPSSFSSGYYWFRNSLGSIVRVYCDMTRSCGGTTGGWTRVANLNTTSNGHVCPIGFTQRTDGDIRTCVRNDSTAGCSSIMLPTEGINYYSVCGRVTAYQVGLTDGFHPSMMGIDTNYVDGVSLTHSDPRQHIWTFASGLDRTGTTSTGSNCPCQGNSAVTPPSFVGNDHFCDSGNPQNTGMSGFFTNPLWDGSDCLCCTNPPWFYKQLPQPTTDVIEMRVCRDEAATSEDIAIQEVEVYIN